MLMSSVRWFRRGWMALLLLLTAFPAAAQLVLSSEDGSSTIKFGFLMQARAESFEDAGGDDAVNDLYFRRLRLLAGGTINDKFSFFFETDSPNLGKGTSDGSKSRSDIYIQDFVINYNHSSEFILDVGLILIPTCYNCNNSAASLLPVDYGAYSFLSSAPTTANVGRDYGVQARGYLFDDQLEYRAGVFQGARGDGTNSFRYAGRLMWNFLEPQKGLFYSGTSLGTKRLFSIGASYDAQEEYSTYAFDIYFDHPLGDGDGITLQADWVHYDGDTFLTALPETNAFLFEAGYYFSALKLAPFLQYLKRDLAAEGAADETSWQAGLAYYPKGHKMALKLGLGQLERDGSPDRFRAILQLQVLMF